MMFPPPEQIGSSGAHKLSVFPPYAGLIVGSGWPPHNMVENPLDGSPNRATAATWSATEGGICVVAKSITVEPCEYPPSTIFVFGQLATRALNMGTRIIGSGVRAVVVIVVRRIVDRVDIDGPPADLRGERVDECLSDIAEAGFLMGAAREHHRDVGAWIG